MRIRRSTRRGNPDAVHAVGKEQRPAGHRELGAVKGQRRAVGLGGVIHRQLKRRAGHVQRAVQNGDVVVVGPRPRHRRTAGDRKRPVRHLRICRSARRGDPDAVDTVGKEQRPAGHRKLGAVKGQRRAVGLGGVIHRQLQRCAGDVQRALDKADGVVFKTAPGNTARVFNSIRTIANLGVCHASR